MPDSQHLIDFRAVWGDACHTMWIELAALRCTAAFTQGNYMAIPDDRPLTDLIYAPESKGRMDDVTKSVLLGRMDRYMQAVVTGRVVLLSAAFELYFRYFLDAYLMARPKYFNSSKSTRTDAGNKVYGEVAKVRGLAERVVKFGEETGARIKVVDPHLPALTDVYYLRNVIAHRAGAVDTGSAEKLSIVKLLPGQRVTVSVDQLLSLAAPVLKLAEALDRKILGTDMPPTRHKRPRPR